jgi:hypothetical protein
MKKRELMDEIRNFIEYYTSDDNERMQMDDSLIDYMLDVYTEQSKNVHFFREGEFYLVNSLNVPQFKIHKDEKDFYVSQYLNLGYTAHIG